MSDKWRAQLIERGRYGAYPEDATPWRSVWPTRLRGLAVGHLSRFGLWSRRSVCRELDGAERMILEQARQEAGFRTVSVGCAPEGFVLWRCESVPGQSDLVTLYFRAADEPSIADRAVSLSQRKGWLPLREELELARVPFTRIRDGDECYLVHGVYGGEPIDHAYWCWTQRSLAFEVDGIVCELRSEAGRGPGLTTMLTILVVSSDLEEILVTCDRILVLHAGRVALNCSRSAASQEMILAAATSPAAS